MTEISPELREAARAICQLTGLDPDAISSSAYGAPENWEAFVPQAQAAGAAVSKYLRVLAEVARAAVVVTKDQIEAERLKARGDALHEAADMTGGRRSGGGTVLEFRRTTLSGP